MEIRWIEPGGDLSDAYAVRIPVFVDEQGFVNEIDDIDPVCRHIVIYEDGRPVATGRIIKNSETACHIGRIAVIMEKRGGLGKILVDNLVEKSRELGFNEIMLDAQTRVLGFYEKCGFAPCGGEVMDEHVPHTPMKYIK